jgi:hypothetical protein
MNAGRPPAPWCKVDTLVDDFSSGAIGTLWTASMMGACTYRESSSAVTFTMTGLAATSLCEYMSTSAYDLTSSQIYINIPAITSYYPPVSDFLRLSNAGGQFISLSFLGSNQLSEIASVAGAVTSSYVAANEGWWRLRESGGILYWETSPDSTTWNIKRQTPTPFPPTAVQVELGVSTNATMPNAISISTLGVNTTQ